MQRGLQNHPGTTASVKRSAGEFGELQEARKRLELIVPISLLLILRLLYALFNSTRDSLLALTGRPFKEMIA